MFGSKVNITNATKLFELIATQLYKIPDNYLKVSRSDNFESIVNEAHNPNSSNISQLRSEMKATFKQLDMSKDGFGAYFSFLWHSSLPCFDIANITAEKNGDTAVLKRCYWKGQKLPCSAIFQKVNKYFQVLGCSEPLLVMPSIMA